MQRQTMTVADGRSQFPITVVGDWQPATITLKKPLDLNNDAALIKAVQDWREGVNAPFVITCVPVNRRDNSKLPGNFTMTYNGCKPGAYQVPAINAGDGSQAAMLTFTFSITSFRAA